MAGNALAFTISLVDKMSAPAKAMSASLGALETQLKSAIDLAKQLSELGVKMPKVPSLPGGPSERAPKGKMFGPSRKDFEAQQRLAVREADRAAKMAAAAEVRAAKSAAAEQEKLAQAPWKGAEQALKPIQLAKGELEQLKQQLRDDKLAVTNLSASLGQLKAATVPNVAAIQAAEKELQRYKNSLGETQAKLVASGNAFRFGSEGTNRLTTTLRELAEAAGAGGAVGRLSDLRSRVTGVAGPLEELGAVGPKAAAGIGALVVAALAGAAAAYKLGAALAGLVKSGAEMAIQASEARGDTLDMLEVFLGTRDVAEATYDKLLGIGKISAASQEAIQSSAQQLSAAGVKTSDRLVAGVKAIAQVESVLKGGGSKIQNILERASQTDVFTLDARRLKDTGLELSEFYATLAKRTGKGVKEVEAQLKAGKVKAAEGIDALAETIDKKFGKLALGQAMDFEVQMQRLRDNIKNLFAKVDTGPFSNALERIVALFDEANPSGAALRDVLTSAFSGVMKLVEKVEPYVTIFLLGLELAALKVANAFKPLMKQLGMTFGGDQAAKQEAFSEKMIKLANIVGTVADAIVKLAMNKTLIAGLGTAFDLVMIPIKFLGGILLSAAALFAIVGAAIVGTAVVLKQLGDWAIEAGTNFVTGLIEGITGNAGRLVEAVMSMGRGALDAFTGFFDMNSPSRVMMEQGKFISLGVAAGIDQSAPVANDNMRDMLEVPPPRVSEPRAGRTSGECPVVHIDQITITGVQNAEDIRREMPEVMADVMEQAALMVGTR